MDSITKQERAQLEEVFASICADRDGKFKAVCLKLCRGFFAKTGKFIVKRNYKFINNLKFKKIR